MDSNHDYNSFCNVIDYYWLYLPM